MAADQVLDYVKRAHAPEAFDIEYSITDHPEWELKNIPLSQLNLDPDGEEPDPYNRVNWVDNDKVQELIPRIASVLKSSPIVVDPAGWIIDGNHRAMAASEAGLTSVPALVPVKQDMTEGTEQKPVVIYTNNKGATIDDGIKKSLRTTQEPFNKLQMWEKHKSMKDPKIADWVTNKLLPELKQNGVLKPLLVWNNNGQLFVIDGNHRFLAYQEAGYRGRVPVQIVPDNMITISDTVPGQQGVAEGLDDNRVSFKVQKGKNKFATTLSMGNNPVGVYQYNATTGRSIAEVYPEFKGKGLGKLLVLHAIYTATQLGLDFQEDESRTSEYDNVLDSLSSNGYIVDDDGYWYVTGEGEQYLKQSLKQDVAENFADGRVKGKSRPGRVKRSGASCDGSVTDLRARANKASGERAKMYHWCANMKSGKKK